MMATSARIAAMMTRMAVALRSASSRSRGSLQSFAENEVLLGSGKVASSNSCMTRASCQPGRCIGKPVSGGRLLWPRRTEAACAQWRKSKRVAASIARPDAIHTIPLRERSCHSHIATLVERQSRFVILVKVPAKDTNSVVDALVRQVKQLPAGLMSSLTWDRGTELADHKRFSVATDVSVYFCDPQSPWQRGSNENTNGLLRQYFPKGTELSGHSQKDLDAVARQLNTRPRKTLGFTTPAAMLARNVASTA